MLAPFRRRMKSTPSCLAYTARRFMRLRTTLLLRRINRKRKGRNFPGPYFVMANGWVSRYLQRVHYNKDPNSTGSSSNGLQQHPIPTEKFENVTILDALLPGRRPGCNGF